MQRFTIKWITAAIFLVTSIALTEPAFGQLNIMPLGDSITQGELQIFNSDPPKAYHSNERLIGPRADGAMGILETNGGYRIPLTQILADAGWDFDMVGERDFGGGNHEGYPGYMTSDIIPLLPDILDANNPDIVLLHIGTNDLPFPIDADSCFQNIRIIIDIIHEFNPTVKVILAQIIPCLQNTDLGVRRYPAIIELNELLPQIAASRSYVSLIDMWTPFTESENWEHELMSSTWHPNDAGYQLMAETWATKLQQIVRGRSPVITDISPDSGFIFENDFQCIIQGDFFEEDIRFYLQHENGSRLHSASVSYQNTKYLFSRFDLSQATVGEYQLVGMNPNKMRSIHSPAIFLSILDDTTQLKPALVVEPDSLSFSADEQIKYFQIRNEGDAVLDWQIATESLSPWIESVIPHSGSITPGNQVEITVEIDLSSYREGMYHDALEINANSGDALLDLTAIKTPPLPYSKRVICGSSGSFTDNQGRVWEQEQPFQEGSWGFVNGNVYESSDQISNTENDYLYQTERWGSTMEYHFIVPAAQYNVVLHFAEIYHQNNGSRQFSVNIENSSAIDALDIYREAGHDAALIKSIPVSVSDGYLDMEFTSSIDAAKISAIEIQSVSDDPVLAVSSDQLDFGTYINNRTLRIMNSGFGVLNWSVSEPDAAWLNIDGRLSGSLQAGEEYALTISVNRSVLADGNYSGELHISSNGGQEIVRVNADVQNTDPQIAKNGLFEFELSSENSYQNPYTDVNLSATFSGPNGERLEIEGYWFDENIWKIRFMPTAIGEWTFVTSSNDNSLGGIRGRLECVASSRSGLLKVSKSNPYIFELNGEPFFWMGETSWLLMSDAVPFDGTFQDYITTRKSQNFNSIHFVLGTGGLPVGTHNPSNEGGNLWFSQQDQKINPDFFKWMDKRFEYLDDAELVVGFFITWAQHYVSFTRDEFERFERYLIARYAAYPLLYWTIVGEFDEAGSISDYNYHGNIVSSRDPYGHLISNHPGHSDPNNIGTSRIFTDQNWFSFLMQQYPSVPGEKTPSEINQYIIDDRRFNMPVVNIEFGYEKEEYQNSVFSTEDTRKSAWSVVTGGGFFNYGHGETIREIRQSALQSKGVRQMVHLYNFMNKLPWWQMEPANHKVRNGFCLANGDQEFVIYLPEGDSVSVDLSSSGDYYLAQWYNPIDGTTTTGNAKAGGKWQTFCSPLDHDVVLHLKPTRESVISATPEKLKFTVTDTTTKPVIGQITVTDPVNADLSWTAREKEDVSWLTLENSGGSSGDQLIAKVNTNGIPTGEFSATIIIEASNVPNSPVAISVFLSYVSVKPVLEVNPLTLTFHSMEGESNPAGQVLTIQNNGLGELNWTTEINPDVDWLSLSDTAGIGERQLVVSVNSTQVPTGTYNSVIRISDPLSQNQYEDVNVALNVAAVAQGPILAEFQAEESESLPNPGWEVTINDNESGLLAVKSDISGPPEEYRLDYSFNVPEDVSTVFVFAEVDVNSSSGDDSFWIQMNGSGGCNWNGLSSLGDGWNREWVYDYRNNRQHSFPVNPGINTLSLYPREAGALINWIVVTMDRNTNISEYEIEQQQPSPESPKIAVSSSVLNFAAVIGGSNPPAKSIAVNNSGIGSLSWTAEAEPEISWLDLDNTSGTAGEQFQIVVDITDVPEGSYDGSIRISDPNASNSPVIIPVNLTITGEAIGPIVAEFDAEASTSLPNDGWVVMVNENESCIMAAESNISVPPEQYRLDYLFNVPAGVSEVYVFAEVDVNSSGGDDSFYIKMNGSHQCVWNGLSSLGDGWKREWVYDYRNDNQHRFPVEEGQSTLSLYPREHQAHINWLVVTSDKHFDMESYTFNDNTPPPTEPEIAANPKSLSFSAVIDGGNPSPKTITVNNSGAGTLSWNASEIPETQWLQLSDSVGSDGEQISVAINIAGLTTGNYESAIVVSDTASSNGSVNIPVRLVISEEVTGPVLAEFDAEQSESLPNDGWKITTNDGQDCLVAIEDDISSPPDAYRLDYEFMVPPGVSAVYVFAEVDVNGSNRDDSFWIEMNGNDACNWNNLHKLGDGWKRAWVYDYGRDNQHSFSVNAGLNTLNLYVREQRAFINWLVITTDKNMKIDEFEFNNDTLTPTEPVLAVQPKSLNFSAIENEAISSAKKVKIENAGSGTLNWDAEEIEDRSWLSLTDIAGQAGDELTVQVETGDLASGSYEGTIKISDPNSANKEVLVQVLLTITIESDGPVLAEFEAESGAGLPNLGWEIVNNENELSLQALTSSISAPNDAHRLDYIFSVPDIVDNVFVFAEVDVNNSFNDDSFWVTMNGEDLCQWNNLKRLGDGWNRAWIYDQGTNKQHEFSVQPGTNRLSIYPRERKAHINWLVVTTNGDLNIDSYLFGEGLHKEPNGREMADNQPKIPEHFNLYQNYPNPFNPSTMIRFDLPFEARVRLSVFNVIGQEVQILVDENLPAGKHQYQWMAADRSGRSFPSGVYFCQIEVSKTADSGFETILIAKKMLLKK